MSVQGKSCREEAPGGHGGVFSYQVSFLAHWPFGLFDRVERNTKLSLEFSPRCVAERRPVRSDLFSNSRVIRLHRTLHSIPISLPNRPIIVKEHQLKAGALCNLLVDPLNLDSVSQQNLTSTEAKVPSGPGHAVGYEHDSTRGVHKRGRGEIRARTQVNDPPKNPTRLGHVPGVVSPGLCKRSCGTDTRFGSSLHRFDQMLRSTAAHQMRDARRPTYDD
mmetsp:Transcript_39407/g.80623  ORF Transcript_39407/g.80623 Transcript_39407/m.80623 type:complete len:219 (-) Transcript_39407:24-680(-)